MFFINLYGGGQWGRCVKLHIPFIVMLNAGRTKSPEPALHNDKLSDSSVRNGNALFLRLQILKPVFQSTQLLL